jgi:carboxyl-terminal processing protease
MNDRTIPAARRLGATMIRRVLLLLAVTVVLVLPSFQAFADRRVALVIGNAAYQNVARLDNPRNDATLMANTLQNLGFILTGGGAQIDLDKTGLDAVVQKFGAELQGADVAMFYYAGHGVQVRGANYLVPIGANPTREADVDFQMVDVNVVLRQMEAAGTRLNLVVLDACRNNPFGGRGLRATDGGLAQMRAPEGTLISFATQPGNVALDGQGNSPYTTALATTITKPGLDIFQTFNEVGLAVKRSTGGSQQPWVSSSPIDGNFYFVAPQPPASTPNVGPDEAAQAWAAARDTTSLAVLDTFIAQYGNSIYGPFARARREELKNSQVAMTAPKPPVPLAQPTSPRLTSDDVVKLFEPFTKTISVIRSDYVEQRPEQDLIAAANSALRRAYPPAATEANFSSVGGDLNSVYGTALAILNRQPTNSDDAHVVEVAINGVLASLDPHSSYMSPADFRDMQTQAQGSFGGLGMEVSMENGLIRVVAPLDGTPAAKAGIRANDVIVAIDDVSVQGVPLNTAVNRMRGPVGTQVKLKVVRQGIDNPFEMILVRDIIRVRTVTSRIEGGDVGYIKISSFNEQTDNAFKQAVADLSKQAANDNIKGYIIDLRNDPGGLLDQAVSVSDDLLERGEIVSTRPRRAEETQRFSAKPGDVTKGKRLVVLINGGTASGSEIVAGALQDNKRATLIGTRSFGKGSVQTIIPLGADRGVLRLTTARYYTPSGASIQAKGILPDLEVVQDEPDEVKKDKKPLGEATLTQHLPGQGVEQVASQSYVPKDPREDKALAAAMDFLHPARGSSRNSH